MSPSVARGETAASLPQVSVSAVTVPPRDIRLATVDTSAGIVTFDVVGSKTAHDEVAQAASTEHTENLCVHLAPLKQDATAR